MIAMQSCTYVQWPKQVISENGGNGSKVYYRSVSDGKNKTKDEENKRRKAKECSVSSISMKFYAKVCDEIDNES